MPELEAALAALGEDLRFPPTPDLAAAVGARLRPRRPGWERLALAAAVVLAVLGIAVAAWAPARDTVAGWLGVPGVGIERVPKMPPATSPSGIDLGSESTLAGAEAQAGFHVSQASGLGMPRVFVAQVPSGREVALVYKTAGGEFVLTELRGSVQGYSFEKLVGPETLIEPVTVNGENGWWLSGHPHAFFYDDAQGNPQMGTLRLASNTLAWEQGGIIYRLEGASLSKSAALAIAASLH